MSVEPMVKADIGGLSIKRDEKCMISVFPGLHISLFLSFQMMISLIHDLNVSIANILSHELKAKYIWESSANIIHLTLCKCIISSIGAMYIENNSGPNTEPCGTP